MRVLLVDDDEMALMILQHLVREAGHEPHLALSAEAALRILRQESFPLLICDWEMPGMSGLELCRAVRAACPREPLRLVLATAHDAREAHAAALAAGADAVAAKPFDPGTLLAQVRAAEALTPRPKECNEVEDTGN